MRNLIFLLLFVLTSCYRYEYPSFPTLSGEYILSSVTLYRINTNTGAIQETVITSGSFSVENPIGPLDSMTIGLTQIEFTGVKLYMGYREINGTPKWEHEYYYRVTQDFFTREWVYVDVDYVVNDVFYPRRYVIVSDGLEYLVLDGPNNLVFNDYGVVYTYTMNFLRQ